MWLLWGLRCWEAWKATHGPCSRWFAFAVFIACNEFRIWDHCDRINYIRVHLPAISGRIDLFRWFPLLCGGKKFINSRGSVMYARCSKCAATDPLEPHSIYVQCSSEQTHVIDSVHRARPHVLTHCNFSHSFCIYRVYAGSRSRRCFFSTNIVIIMY